MARTDDQGQLRVSLPIRANAQTRNPAEAVGRPQAISLLRLSEVLDERQFLTPVSATF